jgi:hypothetical protein
MVSHFQRVVKEKPPVDIQLRAGLLRLPGPDPVEAEKLNRKLTAITSPISSQTAPRFELSLFPNTAKMRHFQMLLEWRMK